MPRHTCFSLTLALSLACITCTVGSTTIEPLPNDCSAYPSYDSSTQSAGPWPVIADSTGSSVDGGRTSIVSFTNDGRDRYGFVTVPQASGFGVVAPNVTLRCIPGKLQAELGSGWVDVSIASDENWQSSLSFGLQDVGIAVAPFAHWENGTRVPGVFLGAKSSTRWKYKHNWGGNAGEYFLLRWLEEQAGLNKRQDGPIVDDRDWVGYLKVIG